jgi:transcriptional regulator with XRE-family HTH domain
MIETKDGFAYKLNTLLELKRKPDGSKYTQEEVVQSTKGVLSRAYLWKLRTGRAKNPGFHIVQALADFFEVDIRYFSAEEDAGVKMIDQAREDALVEQITLRSSMLSREGKLALLNMIDFILKDKEGAGESQEP